MDIIERYPCRYDVLDFYGRKFAEEFAAWNPEPDNATKKNSTASTKPGGPSGCGRRRPP